MREQMLKGFENIECFMAYYFANIGPSSQGYGFSSAHVWVRELDCEEG